MLKRFWIVMIFGIVVMTAGCSGGKETKENTQVEAVEEADTESEISEEVDGQETVETDNEAQEKVPIEEVVEEEIEEVVEIDLTGKAINPLTGLYIDEEVASRRPYGVMISNIYTAYPHSGISKLI